ncbi:uncharacterized protein LOC107794539 [Nicotiana tabacum]|uniref:Uncharacterized protein LOC107794539 n=1 Tax=Nicotiana tabacum TaxID=4097 RepID=A0A1S4A7F6_TOBAC|nr:PREDICTED: uncharacterized protein LOC107794539 [Nicotiana tabacum]
MKNQPSIRPLGQRSIASTFLFRSSNQSTGCEKKVESKATNQKGSSISLSDFLSKKLHKSPVLPGVVPGNKKISVPASSKVTSKSINGQINRGKDGETGIPCALDAIFEQYKNTMKGNQDVSAPNDCGEVSVCSTDDVRTSRKRGLIEGSSGNQSARKVLAVLGEGSAEKRRRKVRMIDNIEKPSTLFNHYANGGGWWDCNMEGVDNEEVGCNEVWEGMGSTTLGGLEWH